MSETRRGCPRTMSSKVGTIHPRVFLFADAYPRKGNLTWQKVKMGRVLGAMPRTSSPNSCRMTSFFLATTSGGRDASEFQKTTQWDGGGKIVGGSKGHLDT